MFPVKKTSILTMVAYELVTLSHKLDIGNHTYYLVQLCDKRTKEVIYTWEEVSIIRSRFPNETAEIQKYIQKGKMLQKQTRWPETRYEGLMQVRQKFWDEQNSENSSNVSQSDQKDKNRKIKQKKVIKRSIKLQKYQEEKTKSNKELFIQAPKSNKINRSALQVSETSVKRQQQDNDQKNKKEKNAENFQFFLQNDRSQCQYYKILNMKISGRQKKSVYFTVENILGQQKQISSLNLRKTHLIEIIQFYEQYLGVKK